MDKRLIGSLIVFGLTLAACGDDDSEGGGGAATGTGVQSTSDDGDTDDTEPTGTTAGDDAPPADPNGVLRMAYNLTAAERGGFQWNPVEALTAADAGMYHWVYGGLMRPAPDGTLVPDLAESMEIVDPNTIEVVLREGLTLADGTSFDAELVKQAIEHNLSQEVRAFGTEFYKLSSVEVLNPTTLRLTIPDGSAAGWADMFLGGSETMPVPPGTNFDQPLGAGPYTVAEFVPEERVVLEKNPEYWDADSIRVARIELVNAPTFQAAVSALNADQVDWAALDAWNQDAVRDEFELISEPAASQIAHVIICKNDGPLADPTVRRALSMAIDRDALNEAFFDGEGLPAWDLWPEGHRFHNPELAGAYGYDPDAARELLAEAGRPEGFTFDAIPLPTGGAPEIAQVVQQQFADIGVTMDLDRSGNFVEELYNQNTVPVGILSAKGTPGIGKLRSWAGESIGNICHYDDPELNQLIEELHSVSAQSDDAVELWHEIQKIGIDDMVEIPLLFQPRVHAFDAEELTGAEQTGHYPIPIPEIRDLYVKQQ